MLKIIRGNKHECLIYKSYNLVNLKAPWHELSQE